MVHRIKNLFLLEVTIDVSYSKPSDFFLDPPNYCVGSSITLTCRVEGTRQGLTYHWSSNCTTAALLRAGPRVGMAYNIIQWTLILTCVM